MGHPPAWVGQPPPELAEGAGGDADGGRGVRLLVSAPEAPALRKLREGRGAHCVATAREIKSWATRLSFVTCVLLVENCHHFLCLSFGVHSRGAVHHPSVPGFPRGYKQPRFLVF